MSAMTEGTPPVERIEIKWADPVPVHPVTGQPCNCSWTWKSNGWMEIKFLNSSCQVHGHLFQKSREDNQPTKVVTESKPRGRPRKK